MLPNFLIIGAMKSGTTSLYHYMKTHPEIFLSSIKEPNFFTKDIQKKDLEWYKSLFSDGKKAKALGEASVNYSKYPHYTGVPQRIASLNKNIKLIYVLRNPLARTCSHYLHNIYAGIEPDSFKEAIAKRPLYIQASLYYMQIQEYLKFFPREQLLIFLLDDLKKNPRDTVKKVFTFLDVDNQFMPPNIDEVKHQTKSKKGKDTIVVKIMKKLPFYHQINNNISDSLKQFIGIFFKKKIMVIPPKQADIPSDIIKLIKEDIAKLSDFLNRDLSFWTK